MFCQRMSVHRQILSHCSPPGHLYTSRQRKHLGSGLYSQVSLRLHPYSTEFLTFDNLLSHSIVELFLSCVGLENAVKVVRFTLWRRGEHHANISFSHCYTAKGLHNSYVLTLAIHVHWSINCKRSVCMHSCEQLDFRNGSLTLEE